MSSNKNRLRTSQPNIFETQLQKYQNIPSAWLCKVQPLYKSACLCTSLIVSRWKCVCLTGVCVCVCRESKQGFFFALLRLVFHMGKKVEWVLSPTTGPPSSGQNKLPKADPSCLPSLPLSGDFNHSVEAAIWAKAPPLPLYSEDRSSLCMYHLLADGIHSDTSCLLIWSFIKPVTREWNKLSPPPLQCHLHLLSLCVFIVWRIKNCLRCAFRRPSCSALITPEPCCAFDCATVSIRPLHEGHPRVVWQCLFLM